MKIFREFILKLFCNTLKGRCVANDEKKNTYIDTDHLSEFASSEVVELIIKEINKN